ncbi:hypothetical protein G9F72_019315 [Clostridium estertheticum]|uniref:hypothetical protein n=1 Tax=Clostridium estertheticum TaxID=238834 RepID=UPI0013E98D7E|nr:hypothetical protein [Clostridium estertheticum]MBZ9688483.1 hypothetical protein [Clostridium estertheticum]
MSLQDREKTRGTSVVSSIISNSSEKKKENKGNLKARSYYLTEELYKAIGLKSALTGADKSTVVRLALTEYLKDILEQYK